MLTKEAFKNNSFTRHVANGHDFPFSHGCYKDTINVTDNFLYIPIFIQCIPSPNK